MQSVPENIHTPNTEGNENSEEVGGESKCTWNSQGEGRWTVKVVSRCPHIQYRFKCSCSKSLPVPTDYL